MKVQDVRGLEQWTLCTMADEAIALDTCKQLVARGATFLCQRIEDGWLFMVREEPK